MLSELRIAPVLSALLSRGGEYGELFYEEVRSLLVLLEDGRIERVLSGTDIGIGIRLIHREKTFYAYTNEVSERVLLSLANDLSRYAERGGLPAVLPASPAVVRGPSAVRVPPSTRGVPGKRGSFGIDDEGTPGERTVLVENGILKEFLHDRLSAMKEGARATGNGRRESYRHKPIPRMSNTIIQPGSTPPEEILKEVDRGLLVLKMGGGQVNTVTGDFMFEVAEGHRIENGMRGEPVRGATITGNGPEVLRMVDRVGSDLGFGLGTCGKEGQGVPVGDAQPTLRIGPPYITVG